MEVFLIDSLDQVQQYKQIHFLRQPLALSWACVQEDEFRDTDTTTWIGKHVPISVSVSSDLIEQPVFLCNSTPAALVESFDVLDGLAAQSNGQMKLMFSEIETSVKPNSIKFFPLYINAAVAGNQY